MTTNRIYRTTPRTVILPVDLGRIREISRQSADEYPDSELTKDIFGATRVIESFTGLKILKGSYEAHFDSESFVSSHARSPLVLPGVNLDDIVVEDATGTTVDAQSYVARPVDRFDGMLLKPNADWDFPEGIVKVTFTAGSDGSQVPNEIVDLIGVQVRYKAHGRPDDYDLVRDLCPESTYMEAA